MKSIKIILFLVLSSSLLATTIISHNQQQVMKLVAMVRMYSFSHDAKLPNTWPELLKFELLGLSNADLVGDLSPSFSMIEPNHRSKFTEGSLFLCSSKPIEKEHVNLEFNDDGSSKIVAHTHKGEENIRVLIFKKEDGGIRMERWKESRFQKMLSETGLVVPEPIPMYYEGQTLMYRNTEEEPVEVIATPETVKEELKPVVKIEEPKPVENVEEPVIEEEKSPIMLYVIGVLAILGIFLVTRKKKD